MEALALRLVLPPLVVALASMAQRHLGDRLGGLVVGLPLTSGTFLVLLLPTHGGTSVAEAAVGMLAGQIAVIVMAVTYSGLVRAGFAVSLLGAVTGWSLAALAVRPLETLLVCSLVFGVMAFAALSIWPPAHEEPASGSTHSGGREVMTRTVLASSLVIALTTGVHVLGPQLAGLLSAAPLVALVLTPSTHRERGAGAVRSLLHGVVRGSVGAAVFAVVVALTVEGLGAPALLLAGTTAIAAAAVLSSVSHPRWSPGVR